MGVRLATTRRRKEACSGEAPEKSGVTIRMIDLEGRLQWRQHKLFKLCAKLPQCKNGIFYNGLVSRPANARWSGSAFKICDSPNSCATHKNWAGATQVFLGVLGRLGHHRFGRGSPARFHPEFVGHQVPRLG